MRTGARDERQWNPNLRGQYDRPSEIRPKESADGPSTLGGVININPFAQFPPPSAIRTNQRVFNIDVPAATANFPLGLSVAWGQGVLFAFNYYEVVVNVPAINMDLFFTFLMNGAPIAGLQQIRTASVTAAAAVFGDNPFLVLPQSGLLTVTATNNSAAIFNVNAAIIGWTFSAIEAQRLSGNSRYAIGL